MLKITIELVSAVTRTTSEIGRMYIANDGARSSSDPSLGDYLVAVCRRGDPRVPRELYTDPDMDAIELAAPKATRAGAVKEYPRLAYNVWRLIARACLAAFPEEMPRSSKKPGVFHALNGEVMRGLKSMATAAYATSKLEPGYFGDNEPYVQAARAWLDAANADE